MKKDWMTWDLTDPETGKTYKQGNLEKKHNIPIDSLVELEWKQWHGEGACWNMRARLWVTLHTRDRDGTPLYSLSCYRTKTGETFHNFTEESLELIELTQDILLAIVIPEWLMEKRTNDRMESY